MRGSTLEHRPNILWLMTDQLCANALGCYGGPARTPHLDRLAAQGVRFTNAVCATPYCSPSRASMVTGLYPHAHGINYNVNVRSSPDQGLVTERGILAGDVTLGSLLHAVGYHTDHLGKWHLLDDDLPYYPGIEQGHARAYQQATQEMWEKSAPEARAGFMHYYNQHLPVEVSPALQEAVQRLGNRWQGLPYADFIAKMGRSLLPAAVEPDVLLTDYFIEQLREADIDDAPFALTCSWNKPHDPNIAPSPYYEMYRPEDIVLPANYGRCEPAFEGDWSRRIVADLGEASAREFMRIYYAGVTMIDDQVGRVLQALQDAGCADNTLVLFTSDHGDMNGGHGMAWKTTRAMYDEILRVPLLVRWPARVAPVACTLNANVTDLTPTLLEAAGAPVPGSMQGISLLRFLVAPGTHADEAPPFAFAERLNPDRSHSRRVAELRGALAVRSATAKYVRYTNGEEYLYDLQSDPGEVNNLAGQREYADLKAQLQEALSAWLLATDAPPLALAEM